MNFGYTVNKTRSINIDRNDMSHSINLLRNYPQLQTCIACGNCVATCTAGAITSYNFRRVQTLVRRGEYKGIMDELSKCMLCGKCELICPRGINTRMIVKAIKKELSDGTL